jgi:hypothetical protein
MWRSSARPYESAKGPVYKGNLRTGSNLTGEARETVLSYDAASAWPEIISYLMAQRMGAETSCPQQNMPVNVRHRSPR